MNFNTITFFSSLIFLSLGFANSLQAKDIKVKASEEVTIDIPDEANPNYGENMFNTDDQQDWDIAEEIPDQITIRVFEGTVCDPRDGAEIRGGAIDEDPIHGGQVGAKWKMIAEETSNGDGYVVKFELQDLFEPAGFESLKQKLNQYH